MKNNWTNILRKKMDLPNNIDIIIQLENFFEDFAYVGMDEHDNIIVRCIENNKDYILKLSDNRLYLNFEINTDEYNKKVRRTFAFNSYVDEQKQNKDALILTELSTSFRMDIKLYYKDIDLLEKTSCNNSTEQVNILEIENSYLKDSAKTEFAMVEFKKLYRPLGINSKYVLPDIFVGTEVYKDSGITKVYPYINRGNRIMFADYHVGDNSLPSIEQATKNATEIFLSHSSQISKTDYSKHRKPKIGF